MFKSINQNNTVNNQIRKSVAYLNVFLVIWSIRSFSNTNKVILLAKVSEKNWNRTVVVLPAWGRLNESSKIDILILLILKIHELVLWNSEAHAHAYCFILEARARLNSTVFIVINLFSSLCAQKISFYQTISGTRF